jgi:hypothetical protein
MRITLMLLKKRRGKGSQSLESKMKKLMNICYKCGSSVKLAKCKKEGITLDCMKCLKCGEE